MLFDPSVNGAWEQYEGDDFIPRCPIIGGETILALYDFGR